MALAGRTTPSPHPHQGPIQSADSGLLTSAKESGLSLYGEIGLRHPRRFGLGGTEVQWVLEHSLFVPELAPCSYQHLPLISIIQLHTAAKMPPGK
jgi:hypothetical protein